MGKHLQVSGTIISGNFAQFNTSGFAIDSGYSGTNFNPTLSQVLGNGNLSSGNDIKISNGDKVSFDSTPSFFSTETLIDNLNTNFSLELGNPSFSAPYDYYWQIKQNDKSIGSRPDYFYVYDGTSGNNILDVNYDSKTIVLGVNIVPDINNSTYVEQLRFDSSINPNALISDKSSNIQMGIDDTTFWIGTDGNTFTDTEGWLWIDDSYIELGHKWNIDGGGSLFIYGSTSGSLQRAGLYLYQGASNSDGINIVYSVDNRLSSRTMTNIGAQSYPVFLGGAGNTTNQGVYNSVMLGGTSGLIDKSNTAFANELRFNSSLNSIVITDSNSGNTIDFSNFSNQRGNYLTTDGDSYSSPYMGVGRDQTGSTNDGSFEIYSSNWLILGVDPLSSRNDFTIGWNSGTNGYSGNNGGSKLMFSHDNSSSGIVIPGGKVVPVIIASDQFEIEASHTNSVMLGMSNGIINKPNTTFVQNLEAQGGDIHLTDGDLYIDSSTRGIVLKSENDNDWKIGIDNMGGIYTDDNTIKRGHTFGLYVQTDTSADVTTTTTETTLLGTSGVGSLTVPANIFEPGQAFHCKIGGEISAGNGETVQMRIKSGSIILGDTGIITLPTITNKFWESEIDFVIRNNGTAGQASIVTNGQFVYNQNSQNTYDGSGFNTNNNTTFDTTIINTLDITVEWGSASASNIIHSDIMLLSKTF